MLDSTVTPKIEQIVPDYELLKWIGGGAYGEVWLARSKATGALRAAKIVWRDKFEDERPFQREFAGIQHFERISRGHPGQLALFHIGRNQEQRCFYYVLELADAVENARSETRNSNGARGSEAVSKLELRDVGTYEPRTLRADLAQGRLPADRVLEIGLTLSEALQHLHKNGLVHRDVKPSNVIFVNGQPKLADIGLVTDSSDNASLVGTEGYLLADSLGKPQGDIFALGKVLYEAATGLDRGEFPRLPEDARSWPDDEQLFELNEIILKACASDPKARYASVEAMLEELRYLRDGKSVKCRRVWQGRSRAAWEGGRAAAVIIAVATGGIFLWQTVMPHRAPVIMANDDNVAKAYQAGYLGLRRGTAEGFREASAAFRKVIQADPRLIAAHAGLFEAYLMDEDHGIPPIPGRSKYLKGLAAALARIAPTAAESHAEQAIALWLGESKWNEAQGEFQQALRTDPDCSMALTYYGYFLACQGRGDEGRQMLKRALTLEPTSPLVTKFLGHCEFVQRHYTNALPFYLRASKLGTNYPSGHYWAGRVYIAITNYAQAVEQFEQWEIGQGLKPDAARQKYDGLREAVTKSGEHSYWLKRLEMVEVDASASSYEYAEIYARLGEKEKALKSLESPDQKNSMNCLLMDEFWDAFRHEPKFADIPGNSVPIK
jgi:tetratricopeptide (TPR) repeat protein